MLDTLERALAAGDIDAVEAALPEGGRARLLALLAAAHAVVDTGTANAVLRLMLAAFDRRPRFSDQYESSPMAWSRTFIADGLFPLALRGDLRKLVEMMQRLKRYDPLLLLIRRLFDAGQPQRAYDLSTFVAPGYGHGRPVAAQLLALMVYKGAAAKDDLKRLAGGPNAFFGDCARVLLTGDGRVEGLGPKHVAVTALSRRVCVPKFLFQARDFLGALHACGQADAKNSAKLGRKVADKLLGTIPPSETELVQPTVAAVWLDMAGLHERAGDAAACDEALAIMREHLADADPTYVGAAVRRCADLPRVLAALDAETIALGEQEPVESLFVDGVLREPLVKGLYEDPRLKRVQDLAKALQRVEAEGGPALIASALSAFRSVLAESRPASGDAAVDSSWVRAYTTALVLPGAPRAALLDELVAFA